MKKIKETRGGIRQGSGAKPKNKVKRVTLSCRIDVTTQATLEGLMLHFKISKGEAVDYLSQNLKPNVKEKTES